MNKKNKFIILLIAVGLFSQRGNAQVKIGDNPTTIQSNSLLELESTNKGLLLPRLTLSATNNASPLSAHVAGMVVYNTATAGTAPNDVTPGYYYNDGSKWVRVADAANPQNIYTTNGTLNSNRVVNMENRTLDFRGTIQNFSITRGTTSDVSNAWIMIRKTNNADPSVNTALVSGSAVSGILFQSANGTSFNRNASINALSAENQTTTNGGGSLVFSTTPLGSISEMERMRIMHNGNVGIGVSSPSEVLHVFGNFRLTGAFMPNNISGTSGQILQSSGANIAPVWINYTPVRPAISGVFPGGSSTHTWCQASFYIGTYIDLPPGKWAVNATLTLNGGGSLPSASGFTWHAAWSEINTGTTYNATSDVVGNANQYVGYVCSPMQFGFINGTIILNNTSTSTKRYYLWQMASSTSGSGASCSFSVSNFARGFHTEDQIIAYPMY